MKNSDIETIKSFHMMRTHSRDRFGTPLEKRFTKNIY